VIRHNGAPHWRSAVLDVAWYQYFLLDVFAVLAIAVVSVVLIVYITLRAVLNKICGGVEHTEEGILRKKKGGSGAFRFLVLHIFIILRCCTPSLDLCCQLFGGSVLASTSKVV
jgi:uncharacterized membrane protein